MILFAPTYTQIRFKIVREITPHGRHFVANLIYAGKRLRMCELQPRAQCSLLTHGNTTSQQPCQQP